MAIEERSETARVRIDGWHHCNARHDVRRDAAMSAPRRFADRYELRELVGVGGMSEVHLARDLRLDRDVAVKVLHADLADDASVGARFRREAQKTAGLNHRGIAAVYDTGVGGDGNRFSSVHRDGVRRRSDVARRRPRPRCDDSAASGLGDRGRVRGAGVQPSTRG